MRMPSTSKLNAVAIFSNNKPVIQAAFVRADDAIEWAQAQSRRSSITYMVRAPDGALRSFFRGEEIANDG